MNLEECRQQLDASISIKVHEQDLVNVVRQRDEARAANKEHGDALEKIASRLKFVGTSAELADSVIGEMDIASEALRLMIEAFQETRCACHDEEYPDVCDYCKAQHYAMEYATNARAAITKLTA